MIHGLPARAVRSFYSDNIGKLGSRFSNDKLNGSLPSIFSASPGLYLDPSSILADNRSLLEVAFIHAMSTGLKRTD